MMSRGSCGIRWLALAAALTAACGSSTKGNVGGGGAGAGGGHAGASGGAGSAGTAGTAGGGGGTAGTGTAGTSGGDCSKVSIAGPCDTPYLVCVLPGEGPENCVCSPGANGPQWHCGLGACASGVPGACPCAQPGQPGLPCPDGGAGGAGGNDGGAAGAGGRDASADAGDGGIACGGQQCGANQVCVHASCGGGVPAACTALQDGGTCPTGWTYMASCPNLGHAGCAPPPCTPPAPKCAAIPVGCGGTATCRCLPSDLCSAGSCASVVDGQVFCLSA
jgi:hypothetical protein